MRGAAWEQCLANGQGFSLQVLELVHGLSAGSLVDFSGCDWGRREGRCAGGCKSEGGGWREGGTRQEEGGARRVDPHGTTVGGVRALVVESYAVGVLAGLRSFSSSLAV